VAPKVTSSPIELNEAIVRIRDGRGQIVGAGFLVGERDILTCAHVVARAQGGADKRQPTTGAEVSLDFPLLAPQQILSARISVWKPPQDDGTGDIAGLRLNSAPPAGAKATRLVTASDLWAHPFRTFGFPARHDDGVWASGRLLSRQATGWVQLEDVKETGFRVERGFSGAPVWDDELHGVVGMAVAAEARPEVRGAYLTPADVLIKTWPQLETHSLPPCPYRGLFAFRELDADLFFGREELTVQLVDRLTRSPLVAVVGPSGSGKSSIVFAGAIPHVRQREGWAITSLRPGTERAPLAALASALLPLLEPQMTEADRLGEVPKLEAVLGDGRLAEVADRSLDRVGSRRLLVVVDQFEELFGQAPTAARQFLDVLVKAVISQPQRTDPTLSIVLTLRADFLGQALEHAGLAEVLQQSVVAIGRMTRKQLRKAIVDPVGDEVTFEAGLVDRILDDVGAEPGNLPLLEFALTLLWESQAGRTLTHASYEALGGVEGALARYAEQVYLDDLPTPEREAARRIFVQLVRPGEATEPTRRVARRIELDESRWAVAQHLAATRLVITGRDAAGLETVEVVHEALISGWSRLRQWIAADHEFRVWQERLRVAVEQWEDSSHDDGALLRGAPLAEAERWEKQRSGDLGSTEHAFIRASQTLQGKATRRLQGLIAILAILTTAAITSAVIVRQQGDRLDRQGRLTLSRYLAVQSEARAKSEPDLAMLLSLAAYDTAPTLEARGRLLQQADERRDVAALLAGGLSGLDTVAFSPDGRMLASGSSDGIVTLWDAINHRRAGNPLDGGGQVTSLAFSPDSRILAVGIYPGGVSLWNPLTRTRIANLQTGELGFENRSQLAFSPDGRVLATGNVNGKILLWDLRTNRRLHTLAAGQPPEGSSGPGDPRAVSLAYNPDGHLLASAQEWTSKILLWNPTSYKRIDSITLGKKGSVSPTSLAFSPNGELLAWTEANQSNISLWSLKRHAKIGSLAANRSSSGGRTIGQIAFSRDGHYLAALNGDDDKQVDLWDMRSRSLFQVLRGHLAATDGLAFSPDGQVIATASDDKTIALFNIKDLRPVLGGSRVTAQVAVRPDGRMFAEIGQDGRISLWDMELHRRLGSMGNRTQGQYNATFSPNGRLLATIVYNRDQAAKVHVWSIDERKLLAALPVAKGFSESAPVFTPDSKQLIVISERRTELWNIASHKRLPTPWGRGEEIRSPAFSSDGRVLAWISKNSVTLWDWEKNRRLGKIESIAGGRDLALTPDGSILVTSGDDVILWDTIRQTRLGILGKGSQAVFSPNGQIVATSRPLNDDSFETSQVIAIWDVNSRVQLTTFAGLGGLPRIAFTTDGRLIVTGDITELNGLDESLAFRRLCDAVGREFTRSEWKAFLPGRKYRELCH
jgi:WD40 repeat protein